MDLHIHVHIHHEGLAPLDRKLDHLLTQGEFMAKKFEEVDADMDALSANVTELIREVGVLIAAGPGVVSQEQLDGLGAKIAAVRDAAKAADPHP